MAENQQPPLPKIYSNATGASSNPAVSGHPTLKVGTIKNPKPPGPNSNYLEWSWILDIHFCLTGVFYLLNPDKKQAKRRKAKVSFDQDNLAVCSDIAKTIHPSNIRYVRQFNTNTRKLWYTLKEAHQDHSSGGMMYWLRKLTIFQMTDDDIVAHLDEIGKIYEQLNSLVSPENPLTTDDIFSVSILTSLPPDWLACVSSLMNNKLVTPCRLIKALKKEGLHHKARNEDLSIPESASNTSTNNHEKPCSGQPRTYYCTFCKREGHSLKRCEKAASILAEHTSPSNNGSGPRPCGNNCRRRNEKKPLAKAGQTTVVELGGAGSNDESDYSGLDKLLYSWPAKVVNAVALFRGAPKPAANAVVVKRDSNIDSGCSITMTPYKDNLLHTRHDDTEICLASHSLVSATHKGVAALTFEVDASVLDLHKPLLSVSGVCDQNLSVVFTSTSCEIYRLKDVKAIGKPVERGYRKGNIYYLPAHEGPAL